MDPKRTRRVLRWFKNLRRPASREWPDRAAWWGTAGFVALAIIAWALIWGLGDRWWPATVLLFGPRWVLLLPLVGLFPLAALRDRALLIPLTLAGVLLLGPGLGFQTGWRSLLAGGGPGPEVRVVSFNAMSGRNLVWSPSNLLLDWEADIAAFQECGRELAGVLKELSGWHVDVRLGLCLASRFEIVGVREMDREALAFAGGAGMVATYELDMDGVPILVTNLHLETPRAGFELIRSGRLAQGISLVREKSLLRGVELRRARFWAEGFPGPHIVVGDFNTPPESRSYRESWGGWQNSFSVAGSGFGGTRLNGWIRVRIDHILANDSWQVMDAWVEEDVGSDHLPVGAVLRLR
ncbi:MAG: hypothetical protein HKO65_12230 [Gemmatimonadetes bacterium]|nr:hypothetical protein [Gemmatimonadota bacterium]